ncbi:hypothetical protein HK100_012331 [Physocladia obscura]|uniref:Uncharacterized protein n=1 Tax=Physocladia obscura TaxID=109957 RepID=A0AAD5SZZ8_9FUNG|nr:hypothetical protein HK100_012331 [Physocladia obscura]
MSQVPTTIIFTDETVTNFGSGAAGDPSPVGNNGYCGNNPTNDSYFAAVQPELIAKYPGVCGQCLQLSCTSCEYGVAVMVVDECTGCTKGSDNGSLSISQMAMGNMLGGGVTAAQKKGVLTGVTWEAVSCPTTWGPISNIVSGGGSTTPSSSSSSVSATSTTTSSSGNGTSSLSSSSSSNTGPIIGGVAAGVFLLAVVAFVLWLKNRQHKQEQESQNMMIINRFGNTSRGYGSTFGRTSANARNSIPAPAPPSVSPIIMGATAPVPTAEQQNFLQSPTTAGWGAIQPQAYYGSAATVPPVAYVPLVTPPPNTLERAGQSGVVDYSQEWTEYFRENPEEYEKYYGVPMPNHQYEIPDYITKSASAPARTLDDDDTGCIVFVGNRDAGDEHAQKHEFSGSYRVCREVRDVGGSGRAGCDLLATWMENGDVYMPMTPKAFSTCLVAVIRPM